MNIIGTERLILRELKPEDAEDLYRIYSDPLTMEFMGAGSVSVKAEREQIEKHITKYYEKEGFGLWATVLKEDKRLIGRCGLLRYEIEGVMETEIAYLIDRNYWGRGLATEAARSIVKLASEKYNFDRLIAVINPQNTASVRVAEKIGMKFEREVIYKNFGKVELYGLSLTDSPD